MYAHLHINNKWGIVCALHNSILDQVECTQQYSANVGNIHKINQVQFLECL